MFIRSQWGNVADYITHALVGGYSKTMSMCREKKAKT